MPSERFNRLKPKKRTAIRDAILKQLREVPLEKFSAKKLTQELELSSGCFYSYFNGIDDMLSFAIEDYIRYEAAEFDVVIEKLKAKDYAELADLIRNVTEYAYKNGYLKVMRNLSYGLKLTMSSSFEVLSRDSGEIYAAFEPIVMNKINKESLNSEKEEYFKKLLKDVISMGVMVYRCAMAEIYCDYDKREEVITEFKRKIRILINGLTVMADSYNYGEKRSIT